MPTHEQTIKAQADAERVIGDISHAATEVEANELAAVARGYAMALCDQLLIGHTQWTALMEKVDRTRSAWTRPERGKGGDYQ